MPSFTEEDYLRQKARALCRGLFSRLDDFVNEFPDGQPSELIKTIKFFLSKAEGELAIQADPSLLRFSCFLIHVLSTVLSWLDNAHTAQTPRGVVQCLNDTSRALFGKAVSVLVSPSHEYNYSIQDVVPPLRDLANKALSASGKREVLDRLRDPFYVVRFPRIERDNVLAHALFGHEFGHPIADEFIAQHEKTTEYQKRFQHAQQQILSNPQIDANLKLYTNVLERQRQAHRYFDDLAQIHRRGLQELISDAFGAYLFGPSALFASIDVLVQTSLDDAPSNPEFYPPNRYRWRLLRRILDEMGHIQCLRDLKFSAGLEHISEAVHDAMNYVDNTVSLDLDQKAISLNPIVKVAYDWLDETIPDALKHAWIRARDLSYSADIARSEIPELVQRLSVFVPPCDVGLWPNPKAVDWRSSLLAGWLMAIAQIGRPNSSSDEQQQILATNQRLTLKGIELALLRRDFDQYLQSRARK